MSTPLVSILIPCYNAAPFLRETLESALKQSHPNTEIILVDDGSTDGSLSIARTFEPRIKVITGPQRGASAARDAATQQARGDCLQYLDADDILLPSAIADRVQCLDDLQGDVVCADWRRITVLPNASWMGGDIEIADFRRFAAEPDLAIFKGFWAPPAAILYRKSLVERIGNWHPGLSVIQDARFLFDAALNGGRFVHLAGESALYRQHASNSLSSRSSVRFWKDVLSNNLEIEQLWTNKKLLDAGRFGALGEAFALGARVTFSIDQELYNANLNELRRFPVVSPSLYLRCARLFEGLLGYHAAVRLMKALRPKSSP